MCRKPKEHLFEVLPYLISIAIKEGLLSLMPKAKINWEEQGDVELHNFVLQELNGYSMSLLSLQKNIDKFVANPEDFRKGTLYSQDPNEVKEENKASKEAHIHERRGTIAFPNEYQEFKTKLKTIFDQDRLHKRPHGSSVTHLPAISSLGGGSHLGSHHDASFSSL